MEAKATFTPTSKLTLAFLEEGGMLDLVYDIDEGDQYRVGRILVNIDGENPHTRRNVVINRLSLISERHH